MAGMENSMLIDFSRDQAQAFDELIDFLKGGAIAHALAGPAGSGKSTIVAALARGCPLNVYVTATTNKAAYVVATMQGGTPKTVHSLLGLQPVDDEETGLQVLRRRREPDIQRGSLVIVDEASMIDRMLLDMILNAARRFDCRVLFVGDSYQLPPVGESESPAFAKVPTSRLTTIHRQAAGNPVLSFANAFREALDGAELPRIEARGETVHLVDGRQFERDVLGAFADGHNARVLAYRNAVVRGYNDRIRRHLLGPEAERHRFIPGESFIMNKALEVDGSIAIPTEGAVVIVEPPRPAHVKHPGGELDGELVVVRYGNDDHEAFVPLSWEAAGAAVGELKRAADALQAEHKRNPSEPLDKRRRRAWREFFSLQRLLADMRPPHASTVHKSQGSTYGRVFVDVGDIGRGTSRDFAARLLYVATSRASDSVTMKGDLPARLYREAA
jgi:ATP-dependent exoDNAse (exonuclease V) alpha subunit